MSFYFRWQPADATAAWRRAGAGRSAAWRWPALTLWAAVLLLGGVRSPAQEVFPPVPAKYFNDYAHVVSPATADELDQRLQQFERQTSEQILVAIFPKMNSDRPVADYTLRVARAWQVGQKKLNNGAVLFVFVQDHHMYIQTGYGLEGALPDALCQRIIDEQIVPRFRAGDFDGGMKAGVLGMLAAAQGEYRGNGQTVADHAGGRRSANGGSFVPTIFFVVILVTVFLRSRNARRAMVWGAAGQSYAPWGGGWGGGGWGGGGGGGAGGGGGFSGGGGSFGGGGAGGSW